MPLNPVALAADIKASLATISMGDGILSASVDGVAGEDGTMETTCTPTPGPVYMNAGMANAIAQAVANAVVKHLTTMALVDISTGMIK